MECGLVHNEEMDSKTKLQLQQLSLAVIQEVAEIVNSIIIGVEEMRKIIRTLNDINIDEFLSDYKKTKSDSFFAKYRETIIYKQKLNNYCFHFSINELLLAIQEVKKEYTYLIDDGDYSIETYMESLDFLNKIINSNEKCKLEAEIIERRYVNKPIGKRLMKKIFHLLAHRYRAGLVKEKYSDNEYSNYTYEKYKFDEYMSLIYLGNYNFIFSYFEPIDQNCDVQINCKLYLLNEYERDTKIIDL